MLKKINKFNLLVNCVFFWGLLFFCLGVALLLVAFGWFGIGVRMRNEWHKSNCTITDQRTESFSNTYSQIFRLMSSVKYFEVNGQYMDDRAGKKKKKI